jgi:sugar/nucleoside kinase (ribokinase family)
VRAALEAEGVALTPTRVPRTPVTAVLPTGRDRAMVTFAPPVAARAEDLERLAPRAVVCGPDALALVPADARAYVTLGDEEARTGAGRLPEGADALLLNEREALLLTGAPSAGAAAAALADLAPAVIVTRGAAGALAVVEGRTLEAAAPAVPVVDTTGAGDLFAAAWAWGERLEPERRLAWATLYAGLSVRRTTGAAGAVREKDLLEEGARRGLPVPVAPETITKEPSA